MPKGRRIRFNKRKEEDEDSFNFNFKKCLTPQALNSKTPVWQNIETLLHIFTKLFHNECLTPDYYIQGFGKNRSTWMVDDAIDAPKRPHRFMPHSRLPDRMKTNYFYKAQRANQDRMVNYLLTNFFFHELDNAKNQKSYPNLFYQEYPVVDVMIQKIKVTGHSTPRLDPDEVLLLPLKASITVIDVMYDINGEMQHVYFDLCSNQLDIHKYNHENYPFHKVTKLEKNKGYDDPDSKRPRIKILEIEESIPIKDDSLLKQHYEEMEEKYDEEVVLFNEYLYSQFRKVVKKLRQEYDPEMAEDSSEEDSSEDSTEEENIPELVQS